MGQTFLSVIGRCTHRPILPRATRRGFTLIQVLVAIGIIVLLMAIALPAIIAARKQAQKTATAMVLQSISTALEAYKQDFGDYPRLPVTSQRNLSNPKYDYGSMLLCWALIGPAGNEHDGATGFGFRLRAAQKGPDNLWDTSDDVVSGRVYGPYLDPSKFRLSKPGDDRQTEILDSNGNAILYFPGRPAKPDLSNTNNYVGTDESTMYNSKDNTQLPQAVLQKAVVDASYTGPFILWTAGTNGLYGQSVSNNTIWDDAASKVKSDDVNNITQ